MIEANNLTMDFGKFRALEDLSLSVAAGEIFGFLGPNGAGKTTTLRILSGLLKPTRGSASLCGMDIQKNPREAKRLIGLVPDTPFVYKKLTGREFLSFVGGLYRLPTVNLMKRMENLLEIFSLSEFADELCESYSRGMLQKLVFASALLHEPRVLLLDEPMVGLDPKSARLVREIILERAKAGAAIFVSTHTLPLAEEICHRIGILRRGRLMAIGTGEEILRRVSNNGNFEEAFLALTQREGEGKRERGEAVETVRQGTR